ncbi:hypothetical protein E8E13_003081 [Curvularia kusanoi]|uniref:Uncharacterized protein n=1 Tax=Curvularia kusanoi TaxID=90978 RepID=A0A9P4W2B7_CURKU|nr:hypothetical protein E8E13_003081 [Curvularia kusanoi]
MPPKPSIDEELSSVHKSITRLEDKLKNKVSDEISKLHTVLQWARRFAVALENLEEKQRIEATATELEQRLAQVEEEKKESLKQLMDAQKRLNNSVLGL